MTDEERQRQMDFILNSQAQTSANINRLSEKVDALADLHGRAENRWGRTEESVKALLAVSEIHEREVAALLESHAAVIESQKQTDKQMSETNERLNILINTIERYISEGRNGKG